ncbi:hypothetical protein D3C80_1608290 [compost metagenome]
MPKYWLEARRAAPASGAPAIAARAPRAMVMIIGCMPAFWAPSRRVWRFLMWPASWAITPRSWLGVLVCRIRPVFRPMMRPRVAKAFRSLSLTSRISTSAGSNPMASSTGSDHSWMMPSISVSRIRLWAEADPAAASTATATVAEMSER